ncbi:MAG TPA: competence/damage-inducible protein A [Gemmatimonadaceae bacterium]
MIVEIVTIGDELLLGETIDINAVWLARELGAVGISVVRRTTVGDGAAAIAAAVREALDRTGGVITTGGLGPTSDDRTRPAIAALFGRELRHDDAIWQGLRAIWRERGRTGEPPESNRLQALVPEGATVLTNRHGTAPGLLLEDEEGRWVAMLPGVPREMRGLMADELLPRLRARTADVRRVIRSVTLRTTGIAESQLPDLLGEHAEGFGTTSLAYLPGQEGVDLRLTVRDAHPEDADRALREAADTLRHRLGRHWYADGPTDLADVVIAACRAAGKHIAVAESCTGGLLAARLTSVSGASNVFLGGVVAYDNAVKIEHLGVDAELLNRVGAVSEDVARAMAAGVRALMRSQVGVGITGIAGPDGGTAEKPVGTVWIAVDLDSQTAVHGGRFMGDRGEIRFRATQAALNMIRRELAAAD